MSVSREHVDQYRSREEREGSALSAELGATVVGKLDTTTLRDVLASRRQAAFDELFGLESVPERLEVMVNLRSGRRSEPHAPTKVRVPGNKAAVASPVVRQRELRKRAKLSGERVTDAFARSLEGRACEVRRSLWLSHSLVLRVAPGQLATVARRADVRTLNSNKRRFALHLDVSRPHIGADTVEANGITGQGVDVAVIDTGIDDTHPALAGVVGTRVDMTGEGINDLNGHGTHCAGVIASQDAGRRGVAPGCTVHQIKIFDAFGSGTPEIAISGIQQAVTDGRQVASNSWGWSHGAAGWVCTGGDCVLCVAADNAVAVGLVMVVSAGNDGTGGCSAADTNIGCPGNARNVITVGATDDEDGMASFSSVGPTPDGRIKPDVTAPGVAIGSCRASTGNDMSGGGVPIDANWIDASGTSMAGPHVAGLCALMLEQNPAATPADVKKALMDTAIDVGATPEEQGSGRVDAVAAVAAI